MSKAPRPIRIEGDIAYIPLTRGHVAIIDAADVPLVSAWSWTARVDLKSDGTIRAVYAQRQTARVLGRRQVVHLHREIHGAEPDLTVDHLDGNGLNNRRGNLRTATHAQNSRNKRRSKNNTSGVKGVRFHADTGKWRAKIAVDYKQVHLGEFGCVTAAALAYAKASMKLHGQFARTA